MIKLFAKWAVNTWCKHCQQQTTSVGDSKQCSKCGKIK
jgi:tRNA(Ile2) C34 agmatinyltransferase TiaS